MDAPAWNHNIHYHELVLRSVPQHCPRALDVGCGAGLLARKLAPKCGVVIAIDVDHDAISRARAESASDSTVHFIEGDVMTHHFESSSFDLVTAVAVLHHLPLAPALTLFKNLLRPAGVLVVIGLYRAHTLGDYAWAAAALPASWTLRSIRGKTDVGAPVAEPRETLDEIRRVSESLVPGSVIERRLLFRYSLTWRKP